MFMYIWFSKVGNVSFKLPVVSYILAAIFLRVEVDSGWSYLE